MKHALWIVMVLVGCDRGTQKASQTDHGNGGSAGIATPSKRAPSGPYVVRYDCSHSDQPFGPGNQVRNLSLDLGAKAQSLLAYEFSSEPEPAPPPGAPADASTRTPVTTPMSDAKIARLEAAIAKVLAGGPFTPEYPVPEGTSCELAISAGGAEVFKVQKATTNEKDAPTELVLALLGS